MNEPTSAHELIMVMGVQRSGTNVLFDSLVTDRSLSAFPEDIDSEFYCNFRFRKRLFFPLNYEDGNLEGIDELNENGQAAVAVRSELSRAGFALDYRQLSRDYVSFAYAPLEH